MISLDPAWRELGRSPIEGPDPLGENPSDDISFETLEAEIDKLQSDPASVDWDEVVKCAVSILTSKGKDWCVACRLTAALYQLHGYQGLAIGMAVLRDMIDESRWEKIFPPVRRAKRRGAFLDWLADRLSSGLEKTEEEPIADDAESLAEAVRCLGEINGRLGMALGDHAPILDGLARNLDQHYAGAKARADARAKAAEPAPAGAPGEAKPGAQPAESAEAGRQPPAGGSAAQTAAAAPAEPPKPGAAPPLAQPAAPPPPSVQLSGDIAKSLRDLKNAMLGLAASLRQARASDARGYLMLRNAIWIDLERLPPNEEGVTQIPEPSAERRKQFDRLQQQGDWGNLINEVEKTLAAGSIFWLDGHRLVANALEELGPNYRDARKVIVLALAALLRRFPGLEKLRFQQGGGFADELTLAWIDAEVLVGAEAPSGGSGGGGSAPWDEAAAEARGLAVKGKIQQGLALFRDGIRQAGSLRERFCWELAQARACAEGGYRDTAAMQTRYLASLVDQYRLDEWEPGLAVELARLYVGVNDRPDPGEAGVRTADIDTYERMLTRLYRYDVTAALAAQEG
jgi:type VI secretion system protein VasJ